MNTHVATESKSCAATKTVITGIVIGTLLVFSVALTVFNLLYDLI